jgi:hydrogenase nickel incorporation protein HypB
MIARALTEFHISEAELLIIENVGNLVCPAEFDLGEDLRVMVYSAVEGAEKPQKYPLMFQTADTILLNKIDLAPHLTFDRAGFEADVRLLNPSVPILEVSATTGRGLDEWLAWLDRGVAAAAQGAAIG